MNYDRLLAQFINDFAAFAHENAVNHGFYDDIHNLMDYLNVNDQPKLANVAMRDFILAQLAKIASEVGEAVAAIQHSETYEHLSEELADIAIRTADLANFLDYQHGFDIMHKMETNRNRPRLHGKTC